MTLRKKLDAFMKAISPDDYHALVDDLYDIVCDGVNGESHHFSEAEMRAFEDKDYRHAYFDEFLNSAIATQIKVLREQRDWTQEDLAERVNVKQETISRLEDVDYSAWTFGILRSLAGAFDLTLCVSFESFGKRLDDFGKFSRENLEKDSSKDDL
ncbi:hypothetical protein LCGC14_1291800 [marine sediment metagenome]|uniref:HTH cro/C1-type domain-containing protein n=1 Tax=marine sediment metagenome TaxID=412755 RepID=A0A0F9KTV1_9ZZZZ